jgi:hypothetical protein
VASLTVTNELRKAFKPHLGDSKVQGWITSTSVTDPELIKEIDAGILKELSLKGRARAEWRD